MENKLLLTSPFLVAFSVLHQASILNETKRNSLRRIQDGSQSHLPREQRRVEVLVIRILQYVSLPYHSETQFQMQTEKGLLPQLTYKTKRSNQSFNTVQSLYSRSLSCFSVGKSLTSVMIISGHKLILANKKYTLRYTIKY